MIDQELSKAAECKSYYNEEDFIRGAQWQAERMYSEADIESVYRMALICGVEPYFIIWFEQFKKK